MDGWMDGWVGWVCVNTSMFSTLINIIYNNATFDLVLLSLSYTFGLLMVLIIFISCKLYFIYCQHYLVVY